MTQERIIQIVKSKGSFEVSWRYRDDGIRRLCERMVRQRVLKKIRGTKGCDVFVENLVPAKRLASAPPVEVVEAQVQELEKSPN